jgi:hypothetical protein
MNFLFYTHHSHRFQAQTWISSLSFSFSWEYKISKHEGRWLQRIEQNETGMQGLFSLYIYIYEGDMLRAYF